MVLFKRILISVLCMLVGSAFILSAISKLPSLEQFGWTIVETTFLNWTMAEWLARILIGLEFFLGVLFIAHLKIKKVAIPLSIGLLILFSVYLLLVIKQYGSTGNCGCFGEWIPMTPIESLIKNLVLILFIFIISRNVVELRFEFLKILQWIILLGCLLIPFIWLPPESIYLSEKEPTLNKPIPLSLLYQSPNNTAPSIELRKGKHVIAFMSLTCRFCRKAAKRMRIMKEKHPELPFYIVLNGRAEFEQEFFDDTKAQLIPHSMFNGAAQFTQMNDGFSLPTIKWVSDTTVIKQSNYLTLDEKEILKWLGEGK